ncbi:GNAT family N-acetyltransferase [Pedobacter deserti]|uniref:GNAT family N-acetyltransferase n=1 Tax=Pedobacter deserti TaxID=2817382 RepID=UPI002109A39E|nr:GNAT family N-acetyltransferase [Pedobacter sp. SYSU D00382]
MDEKSLIATFDCGLADITAFLHDDALAYQSEKMANTYLFEDGNKNVLAFFSISNDCLNDLGEEKGFNNNIWNRLHRALRLSNPKRIRQYPAIKIGRLGVHKDLQGSGIAYQLMDFIKGWLILDHKPACRLLILDAINQPKQLKYYDRNGFRFLLKSDESAKTRIMYYDLDNLNA